VVHHKLRCVSHRKYGRLVLLRKPFRFFVFALQTLQVFRLALRKKAQYVVVSFACIACRNFSSFVCMACRNFPWSRCLPNCKKLPRSFCLLWEVWYLLLPVGVPMVMLIMKRFVYVTHIACSLHDTRNV